MKLYCKVTICSVYLVFVFMFHAVFLAIGFSYTQVCIDQQLF